MIINTSHLIAAAFGISDLLIIMMPVFFGVLSGYFIRGKKTYFVATTKERLVRAFGDVAV